jgi:hypothetical protein
VRGRKHDRHQEPKLSQEDWDSILDAAIVASQRERKPQKQYLNPVLRDYLAKHRLLVQYLHDIYGFKHGVLVATGKDRVGWSSVSNRDVEIRRIDPLRLPVVRKLIAEGASIEQISASKAYKKAIREHCSVAFPLFDLNIGLFLALGRAEQGALQTMPKNRHIKSAILKMKDRALRYFGRNPYSEVTL